MRFRVLSLAIVALVMIAVVPVNIAYAKTATTASGREITIIEKRVCFNITISDIYNETSTKKVCVVVAFHVLNAKPSNETINVEFPVYIDVGNRTIEKKVVVPLKIEGEVVKIEVYGESEEKTPSEKPENVIWVVPKETATTTKPATTTAPKPTSATSKTTAKKVSTPRTAVAKPTATTTAKPVAEKPITLPMPTPKTAKGVDIVSVGLIASLIAIGGVVAYYLVKRRRKVERQEASKEEGEDIEGYKEALKAMKQQLEEKEKEIEELKKSFTYKIYCPRCKESVTPVKTHDNRLLCPKCNTLLGRIRSDGTLEISPSQERGKDGLLREGRNGDSKKETGEAQEESREEANGDNE